MGIAIRCAGAQRDQEILERRNPVRCSA